MNERMSGIKKEKKEERKRALVLAQKNQSCLVQCKKQRKRTKENNSYWVNVVTVLLVDDGDRSSVEELLDLDWSSSSTCSSSCSSGMVNT